MAVVGAGLGGIATAYHLKKRGIENFTVFEQSPAAGGTWYDNSYPGCAVDVSSSVYSYSFYSRYRWSGTHASQPELQQYCEDTIDRFGLRHHFRFSTRVLSAIWDCDASGYRLVLEDGEELLFHVVVSCLGLLNYPKYPDWPGLDEFQGERWHTARWRHDVDLAGKRVAVVGTGSSAVQVVPAIAPMVGHVFIFQRQPGWLLPKGALFTEKARAHYRRHPILRKYQRFTIFHELNKLSRLRASKLNVLQELSLKYIDAVIEDPIVRRVVTPDYPFGCKRVLLDDNFYPALNRKNVELVPRAVVRMTPRGIVDSDGVEREIDILIMATGFQPTKFLSSLEVRGPDGRVVQDVWGDCETFLGITVAGIPNFFMLYGPNTNGGSIIGVLERQAEVVARTAVWMKRRGVPAVDTRKSAVERYMRWLAKRMTRYEGVWRGGCTNYFYSELGRNVTQLPIGSLGYWLLAKILPRLGRTKWTDVATLTERAPIELGETATGDIEAPTVARQAVAAANISISNRQVHTAAPTVQR